MYQEEIVIYAEARPRQCRLARRTLERKDYAFEAVDVGDEERLHARLALVFLGGRLVGGLADIEALERSGDLDRLVRGRV